MNFPSLHELAVDQLKDLYSAEMQLVKALPKIAKRASAPALKEAIESHLEETKGHVERLDRAGEMLDCKVTGQKCKAMQGLLEEGETVLEANGNDAVIDAGIVAAAQRVEHYEMAAYGSARAIFEQLGKQDIAQLLQQTLDEEKAADRKLSEVVEKEIYPQAIQAREKSGEHDGHAAGGHSGRKAHRAAAH